MKYLPDLLSGRKIGTAASREIHSAPPAESGFAESVSGTVRFKPLNSFKTKLSEIPQTAFQVVKPAVPDIQSIICNTEFH